MSNSLSCLFSPYYANWGHKASIKDPLVGTVSFFTNHHSSWWFIKAWNNSWDEWEVYGLFSMIWLRFIWFIYSLARLCMREMCPTLMCRPLPLTCQPVTHLHVTNIAIIFLICLPPQPLSHFLSLCMCKCSLTTAHWIRLQFNLLWKRWDRAANYS